MLLDAAYDLNIKIKCCKSVQLIGLIFILILYTMIFGQIFILIHALVFGLIFILKLYTLVFHLIFLS